VQVVRGIAHTTSFGRHDLNEVAYGWSINRCMRSAKNSTLVKECREFLQTAEAWLQAADLLEAEPRRAAVVQPNSIS